MKTEIKQCSRCCVPKGRSDFHADASRSDGLRSACKLCNKLIRSAYRADNPDKVIAETRSRSAYQAAYRLANKNKLKAYLAAYSVEWKRLNPEKIRAAKAKYRALKPEAERIYGAKYRVENAVRIAANDAARKAANPDKNRAKSAKYNAAKIGAIPAWFSELDDFATKEAASLAKNREDIVGGKWHVDHQVPLNSKRVCGLHVHQNLAVIPALMNCRKGNRYWPDMGGEP